MNKRFLRAVPVFRSVRYRPVVAGLVLLSSQLVTVGLWFAMPHMYRAEALVLLEVTQGPAQVVETDAKANVIGAKLSLLRSRLLTDRVVARLGPGGISMLRGMWSNLDEPRPPFEDWVASVIGGGLMPATENGSFLLRVGYVSPSPEFSTNMANLFANELVAVSDLLNRGFDRYADRSYEQAEARLRQELLVAQRTLAQAASKGVMSDGTAIDAALGEYLKMSQLTTRSVRAYVDGQALSSVAGQSVDVGDKLDDSYLTAQRSRLADMRNQQAEAVTSMGAAHPVVKALDSSIRSIEQGIRTYEEKRRQSIALAARSKGQVVTQLSEREDDLKSARLGKEQLYKSYETDQQNVTSIGDRYENAMLQHSMMALNRDVPRTDSRVVSDATIPVDTWFPTWYYYFPACFVLGLINAILAAYFLERRDQRVRSKDDLVAIVGVDMVDTLIKTP
ncbi:MAG: hypothetical protein HY836_12575 [Aquabacterium sp.]|uniref:hypothetical protein n=1 Tax=Aquabacterium sp. TaxID=1872578 RepID=UPI0025C37F4E|nr:hypothetical protein [Aquabacterium sp.]MBI5926417.1 hypothetical protein [Aquabacterium sp.]